MPPKAAAKPAAKAPAKAAPAPKTAAKVAPKTAAPAPTPAAPKAKAPAAASNGIYVKNWGSGSVADAKATFQAAGAVSAARIRRNKYALVWFDSAAAVKKAVESFNGKELFGSTVTVTSAKAAPKPDKHENTSVVHVSPIFRQQTTRKEILAAFPGAKKLRTYRNNYAYVYYESAAAAQKALKEKHGAEFKGHKLSVKMSTRSLETEKKKAEHGKAISDMNKSKKHSH
jgi:RNA recognition motif-containing protein